jgi:integral membrane protein
MDVDHIFLRRLRILGFVEGISTLVLFFVAMPLKYLAGMPIAVTIAGSVHGALFLGFVAMLLAGHVRVPIPRPLVVAGLIGAVVPFGPFVVDGRLARLAPERS